MGSIYAKISLDEAIATHRLVEWEDPDTPTRTRTGQPHKLVARGGKCHLVVYQVDGGPGAGRETGWKILPIANTRLRVLRAGGTWQTPSNEMPQWAKDASEWAGPTVWP